jgi:hypothetical protein
MDIERKVKPAHYESGMRGPGLNSGPLVCFFLSLLDSVSEDL